MYHISVPPQINPFDFGQETVNSGDIVIATCIITKGDFPLKVHWMLNNKPIGQFDGISISNTNKRVSQLTIESAEAHHSGQYKCVAENKAGVTEFSTFLNVNGTF